MDFLLVCLFLGILVGIVSSLFGIGGGIFIVPLLPTLTGCSVYQAVATSLTSVFLVTFINTLSFAKRDLVDWKSGLSLGIPSGIMAFIAGNWALASGEDFLRILFLGTLIVLLVVTYVRRHSMKNSFVVQKISLVKRGITVSMAIFAGFVSAFTGIGAGIILSPIMFNFKMVSSKKLVPTTNLSTMLTTFAGSTIYFLHKGETSLIDFKMAFGLFFVAMITGYYVRPYQEKLTPSTKAIVMCVVLFLMISKQCYQLWSLHFS